MTASRGDRLYAAGLFAVAFAARLWAAFTYAAEPVWDGHYYDFGARRIAAAQGYSDDRIVDGVAVWHPWCHYPVGYSGYLAAFYKLFGAHAATAHVANALAGAALALFTYLLAREALSPLRAKVAGALVALHPGLVLYGALLMSEPLSALLVIAAFWVALRFKKPWAGALVLGVGALVRPQALLVAPFLALGSRGSWKQRGGAAVLACACALLPVLPWTARNCAVMDGCALVSTNAGWNLAIGAFPRATGRFETLRSDDGCRDVTGQVQQDRCWLAYGIANIEARPWHWLGLVPTKLAQTFDHESFAVEYLREAQPSMWPEARRVAVRDALTAFHRLLVLAAAFGPVALARRRPHGRAALRGAWVQGALLAALAIASWIAFAADTPTFWPMVLVASVLPWLPLPGAPPLSPALKMAASLVATTALAHAVFFGEDRYHVAVTPALCLLAAAAFRRPAPHAPAPAAT